MKHSRILSMGRDILVSLGTLILALICGGVIIAIMGQNPFQAYYLLLKGAFGSGRVIANTLANSIPLMFTGMAFLIAFRSGIFNMGGEGQLYVGGMFGTLVALYAPVENHVLMIILIFTAAIAGGMVWAGLTGVFKAYLGANEVIVAIMLNYVAQLFTSYLVAGPLREPVTTVNQTAMIPEAARLTKILPRTQLTTALVLAVVVAVGIWFMFNHTVLGFKLRCIGGNGDAAQANGINRRLFIVIAMLISGAVASLAGMTEITGKYYRFRENFSTSFGFTGVAVAALGGYNPFGVLVSSILFGGLDTGSLLMSRELGISGNMTVVIQSIIILIVATPSIIVYFRKAGSLLGKKDKARL